jgi:hypothetical protein
MVGDPPVRQSPEIAIAPLVESDLPEVLGALESEFGDTFDEVWYRWKHVSGPWGPSPAWVASDESGLIGVRFFLPWRFTVEDTSLKVLRPCDTVTVPRARGMGVFSKLTRHATEAVRSDTDLLFNTPNEQSRPGYLKMGFVDWTSVSARVGLISPRRAVLTEARAPQAAWCREVHTELSESFLGWRYRDCPSLQYGSWSLESGDGPNGLVARVRPWHGLRLLVVSEIWGEPANVTVLLAAVAHELGARLVWVGGHHMTGVPISISRHDTLVTRFDFDQPPTRTPHLSLGDVESII